jgi:transaldolase/glucose-6-phosphate isomerase
MFLQLVTDPSSDVEIPTQGMTFGTLERAQAQGDYEALRARDRRVLRLHLSSAGELAGLLDLVAAPVR